MMAAWAAAQNGLSVLLLEKNEKLGKKMYITGKGRCNITNNCTTQEFFAYVARNPKFLTSALWAFPPDELIARLNGLGLATKVERGGRVFPQSDKSSDVIKCLGKMLHSANVQVQLHMNVRGILKTEAGFTVRTDGGNYEAKSVIIATGGASYSQTGSTGDGYRFAKEFGHAVLEPHPALSALIEKGNTCAALQGLSLKNVQFTLVQAGKAVFCELGEMLFTHEGLSGPLVLSASSAVNYDKPLKTYPKSGDHSGTPELEASIDLKPALSADKLDARILRDFEQNKNKQIRNVLGELLPQRMIDPVLGFAQIDGAKPVNSVTKKERESLVCVLKNFKIEIKGAAPLEEAIITRGGIAVKEVDPSSLQSKLVPGLFFAGEVLDVDALTGGFNMQIAFSTGYLAGISACKHIS